MKSIKITQLNSGHLVEITENDRVIEQHASSNYQNIMGMVREFLKIDRGESNNKETRFKKKDLRNDIR